MGVIVSWKSWRRNGMGELLTSGPGRYNVNSPPANRSSGGKSHYAVVIDPITAAHPGSPLDDGEPTLNLIQPFQYIVEPSNDCVIRAVTLRSLAIRTVSRDEERQNCGYKNQSSHFILHSIHGFQSA